MRRVVNGMMTFRYGASMPGAVRHRHAALPAYKRFRRGRVKSPEGQVTGPCPVR